jgi:hypothetical protein
MNGDTTPRRFLVRGALIRGALIRGALIRGALPALAATLVLAGCGGTSNVGATSVSAAATASTAAASARLSAFQTCLKQHGVTIKPGQFSARPHASFSPTAFPTRSPFPTSSFAGRDTAAFKACAKYAPAGFGGIFNHVISSSALAAFKSCLSQNGVKVTGTTASAILAELRNSTGKTATAVRTCRVLLQPTAPTPTPTS